MYMTTSSFSFKFMAAAAVLSVTAADASPLAEQARHLFEPLTQLHMPTIKEISDLASRAFLPNPLPITKNSKKKEAFKKIKHEHNKPKEPASERRMRKRRLANEKQVEIVELPLRRMIRPRDMTPLWARDEAALSSAALGMPSPTPTASLSTSEQMRGMFEPSNRLFPVTIVSAIAIFFIVAISFIWLVKKTCHMRRFADPRDYPESTITVVQSPTRQVDGSLNKSHYKVPDVYVSHVPVDERHSRHSSASLPTYPHSHDVIRHSQSPFRPVNHHNVQRPERSHVRMASTFKVIDDNRNIQSTAARMHRNSGQAALGVGPIANTGRRQGYERNFT